MRLKLLNQWIASKTFFALIDKSLPASCLIHRSPNWFHQVRYASVKFNKTITIDNQKIRKELNKRYAETVNCWDHMTLEELANGIGRPVNIIKEVMEDLNINNLDNDSILRIIKFFEKKPNFIKNPVLKAREKEFDIEEEIKKSLKMGTQIASRVPVVTIMGHVDHGKTTLLDGLRHSELVKQEFGGITQHIGAFVVSLEQQSQSRTKAKNLVTFLDTPGHKAFSAMRERGSNITDIVILVVAIDDGVMEQTIESITFAQSSQVPIIVAINKVDKSVNFKKDLEHLKNGLRAHGIILEEDGGDVQAIQMSALKRSGLDQLKEEILALAETLELKAYTDGSVNAVVLESSVDPKKGKTASILVQNGTLRKGDLLIAGHNSWAKVRAMFDEWGNTTDKCLPGFPIQVIGWRDDNLPDAGDNVWQLESEKRVKELISLVKANDRRKRAEIDAEAAQRKLDEHLKTYREELVALRAAGVRYKRKKNKEAREKMIKEEDTSHQLNTIVKCDVTGSLEVMLDIFDSYPNDKSEAKVDLIHYGIGAITEKEVELAACFDRTIIICVQRRSGQPSGQQTSQRPQRQH